MSSAQSQSTSGSVYYSDPAAKGSNYVLWGIGAVVILALVWLVAKGKK